MARNKSVAPSFLTAAGTFAGCGDPSLPLNYVKRPYFGKSQSTGGSTHARYIEVEHGNHFHALIDLLPGSQAVRTAQRGGAVGAVPAIMSPNLPPIAMTPASANAVTFSGSTLGISD